MARPQAVEKHCFSTGMVGSQVIGWQAVDKTKNNYT